MNPYPEEPEDPELPELPVAPVIPRTHKSQSGFVSGAVDPGATELIAE
jgi:hypothetical protein